MAGNMVTLYLPSGPCPRCAIQPPSGSGSTPEAALKSGSAGNQRPAVSKPLCHRRATVWKIKDMVRFKEEHEKCVYLIISMPCLTRQAKCVTAGQLRPNESTLSYDTMWRTNKVGSLCYFVRESWVRVTGDTSHLVLTQDDVDECEQSQTWYFLDFILLLLSFFCCFQISKIYLKVCAVFYNDRNQPNEAKLLPAEGSQVMYVIEEFRDMFVCII